MLVCILLLGQDKEPICAAGEEERGLCKANATPAPNIHTPCFIKDRRQTDTCVYYVCSLFQSDGRRSVWIVV